MTLENVVQNSARQSLTSPLCLEGIARNFHLVDVQAGGQHYTPKRGIQNQWYADVPLAATGTTTITTQFESDFIEEYLSVDWVPLNIAATPQLVIRKGDSLRLMAFDGTASGGTVSL